MNYQFIAEALSEEDKVVHLLARLSESYDVLVTTLESGSDTYCTIPRKYDGTFIESRTEAER